MKNSTINTKSDAATNEKLGPAVREEGKPPKDPKGDKDPKDEDEPKEERKKIKRPARERHLLTKETQK